MILMPSKPTPAMPLPLSVVAPAIDATHVPCPFGSELGSPPNADQPGPAGTSLDCTPVSRTAIVEMPEIVVEPYAWSHPICGSAHWSAYEGSFGVASASRVRSRSTDCTRGSARYSAREAATVAASTSTTCRRRAGIDETSVPPPAAIASAMSVSVNPATVCTMSEAFATASVALSLGAGAEEASVGSGAGAGDASVADGESVGEGESVDVASLADGARVGSVLG